MNDENLIPFNQMSPREHAEISRKGAIASNKKQKERRMMKEVVKSLMNEEMSPELVGKLKDKLPFLQEDMTFQTAMVMGQLMSAMDGNSKAFELLTELNDTDLANKSSEYDDLSVEELRGLLNESKSSNNPKT